MIDRQLAAEVLAATLAGGGDFAELFAERTAPTLLRLDGGRLEEAACGVDMGVGLALVEGERTLYASGNRLDAEGLLSLADRLVKARQAQGGSPAAARGGPERFREEPLPLVSPVSVPPRGVPMVRKAEVLRRADAAARAYDKRVSQVTAFYKDTEQDADEGIDEIAQARLQNLPGGDGVDEHAPVQRERRCRRRQHRQQPRLTEDAAGGGDPAADGQGDEDDEQ